MYLGKPESSHQNLVEGYRPERTLWGGLWKVSLSRLCLLWALEEDLDLSRLQTCFQWRKWHEKTPGCTQSVNSIRHNHQFSCFWSDTHMYSYTIANQIRSDQISRSVVSDSLRPHESQHARPPCPSPTPKRGVGKDASKPMKFHGSTL